MRSTNETEVNDTFLDGLFDAARAADAPMPVALADRMNADADHLAHARRAAGLPSKRRSRETGVLGQLFAVIGGWPAMAGLATATVAGVWIGVTPPAIISESLGSLSGGATTVGDSYLVDTASVFDTLAGEG